MTEVNERPKVSERYASATDSTNMAVVAKRCDADMMLAAGYAAAGNLKGALALELWRMRASGDMRGFARVAETCADWIIARVHRPGKQRLPKVRRIEAVDLSRIVLNWWLSAACKACEGRQHPLIPGSTRLDYSRECAECNGTGFALVDRVVPGKYRLHARFLADEIQALEGMIFSDMARLLAPKLEL